MPAAVMLACAARACAAACCDAASRSAGAAPVLGAAVIGLHAGEAQPALGRRVRDDVMRERAGGRRRHAAATVADVDLDEDRRSVLPARAHRRREALDPFGAIDRDREPDARGERGDAGQLGRVDDLVGDVDVVDAGGRERLGLARLLHADADRAGSDLQAREGRALVHLRVRPQAQRRGSRANAAIAAALRSSASRSSDQRRRVDRLDRLAGRRHGAAGAHRVHAARRRRSRRRPRRRRRAIAPSRWRGIAPADEREALGRCRAAG